MADLASTYAGWKSGLTTLLIIIAAISALLFNILFCFVVVKSKYMRRPANLFLLNLAVADLLGAIFWALPSIAPSSTWQWQLGNGYCNFHGFVAMFCFSLTMYTFTVIAFEKFFMMVFPDKHESAFHNYTITIIVLCALWLLSVVCAFMPLIGWTSFQFYSYQMQCSPDYDNGYSLLNFFVTCVFIIPTVAAIVLYIILFVRVKSALQRSDKTKDGKFVLHERKTAPGDSYAEKMKIQQEKFKTSKASENKKKKKTTKKKKVKAKSNNGGDKRPGETDEGYDSDKCYHSQSSAEEESEEEYYNDYEDYRLQKRNKRIIRARKRVYVYKKQYLFMAITMLITMCIYVGLWLPYYIVTYTFLSNTSSVSEASYIIFTVITFFGISYKPLIYLTNRHIRTSIRMAFQCKKKKKATYGGDARGTTETTTRTVREVHHTEEIIETTVKTRTYTDEQVEEA